MGLSDLIAQFILAGLEQSGGAVELSRGSLAERFGCVPSQINYVLTTRFTPEHGFIIETKRGGGGYIRVIRVRVSPRDLIMHTINAVGDSLDAASAAAFLQNLRDVLGGLPADIIGAACSDRALRGLDQARRDEVRASIFKQCLLHVL
ncbi:MAG: CtsR family transcriptional regulator [Oscillospiraceae bacterium]|nr:CtsR family transcriptional regulator [Oscillospiraceae bacterium]